MKEQEGISDEQRNLISSQSRRTITTATRVVTSPKLGYRREMSHVNIMKYDRALTTAKSIDATSTQY